MSEMNQGPQLVRDDELTRELRAIVAPPAEASYWEGLERRILAHIERGREQRAWWVLSERAYQFGLIAAGVTLIVAGSVFLREQARERRMAFETVIETPAGKAAPQTFARRGLVPDRQATLRAVTDH